MKSQKLFAISLRAFSICKSENSPRYILYIDLIYEDISLAVRQLTSLLVSLFPLFGGEIL